MTPCAAHQCASHMDMTLFKGTNTGKGQPHTAHSAYRKTHQPETHVFVVDQLPYQVPNDPLPFNQLNSFRGSSLRVAQLRTVCFL